MTTHNEEVIRTLEQIPKPLLIIFYIISNFILYNYIFNYILLSFKDNKMKLNPDKCHLILSGKENREINVENVVIKNSQIEKLLGVFFNENANFGYRIGNMFIKTSRKLQALARVAPYMDLSKIKFLMNAFFNSQFSYCPLATRTLSVINIQR